MSRGNGGLPWWFILFVAHFHWFCFRIRNNRLRSKCRKATNYERIQFYPSYSFLCELRDLKNQIRLKLRPYLHSGYSLDYQWQVFECKTISEKLCLTMWPSYFISLYFKIPLPMYFYSFCISSPCHYLCKKKIHCIQCNKVIWFDKPQFSRDSLMKCALAYHLSLPVF